MSPHGVSWPWGDLDHPISLLHTCPSYLRLEKMTYCLLSYTLALKDLHSAWSHELPWPCQLSVASSPGRSRAVSIALAGCSRHSITGTSAHPLSLPGACSGFAFLCCSPQAEDLCRKHGVGKEDALVCTSEDMALSSPGLRLFPAAPNPLLQCGEWQPAMRAAPGLASPARARRSFSEAGPEVSFSNRSPWGGRGGSGGWAREGDCLFTGYDGSRPAWSGLSGSARTEAKDEPTCTARPPSATGDCWASLAVSSV